ncbi:MAG TPA: heme ABC exporter ATP-binding protein CcmA [Devosiaceae bacterium]|jgi:heme exporter protein A|nr:heme ABC exporter ATP-binding protein CcmA [Devosiaceae bacterium]
MTVSAALPPRMLKAKGLASRRGEKLLFRDLDFEVGAGEMLLLRGPNGSGKTTLLLVLAKLLRPESGSCELMGGADGEGALHFLGHAAALSNRLSVAENLRFWSALCGGDAASLEPTLQTIGLAPIADLEADLLSAGQRRRLALGRLLCAERPLWLLDEPTTALDSAGEQLVSTLIDAHLQRGGLVVVATHHDIPLRAPSRVRELRLGAP